MDNSLYTSGNWEKGKNHGTIVSQYRCKCCLGESRDYYGGHLIAESIQNPNDVELMAESKNLLQIAEMFYDYMKTSDKFHKDSIPFTVTESVLKKLKSR